MNIIFLVPVISLSFCLIIFFYFRWYIKRRTSASELLAEHKEEAYRVITEINAVTERNILLVEDSIKKLKALLDDTDKRIAVYVRELERSRASEDLYKGLRSGIRAALKTEVEPPAVQSSPAAQLSSVSPHLTLVRPESDGSVARPADQQLPLPQPEVSKPQSQKQLLAEIEDFASQGLSSREIASRIGLSITEVDFALNLLRRKKS
jgi:hypothetical protein